MEIHKHRIEVGLECLQIFIIGNTEEGITHGCTVRKVRHGTGCSCHMTGRLEGSLLSTNLLQ